jgi:hypothetical protein
MTKTAARQVRCCCECGSPLKGPSAEGSNKPARGRKQSKVCSTLCKATWNNRRKTRGAELYDLWMAMRYEREDAKALGVWKEMCRMSEQWMDDDKAEGRVERRKTYDRAGVVIQRLKDTGRLRAGERYRI